MSEHPKAIIGSENNFWLHSTRDGFDLTHPLTPKSAVIYPRLPLQTKTDNVTVDPAKTALVIIDMQNFFLSPSLGRPKDSKGLKACEQLLEYAIPACRKAGIRIIWLNWGLTQDEIDNMPPATLKSFGFTAVPYDRPKNGEGSEGASFYALKDAASPAKKPALYKGLGSDIGPIELDDGTVVDGGRMLMRDQWNSALYEPLEKARQEGIDEKCAREDVWIHKNRMSGLWGSETLLTKYLDRQGIKTLLFAGVNTDQCVGGSLQDAYTKGFDCLLLNDGCATTTPEEKGGQTCVEYNSARSWGFALSCEDLFAGAKNLENAPGSS